MPRYRACVLLLSVLLSSAARAAEPDLLTLVDPMVGTDPNDGAMYPGAALPHGMVKLSPDTTKPSSAGYNPGQPIVGFSHTHIGGTGGSTFDGQLRVRPQTGALTIDPPASPKANEIASPGYYAVDLTADRVRAELTVTERAGFHRYTFPAGTPARVLIDLAAVIDNNGNPARPAGTCTGSAGKFVSDHAIEGQTSIHAGLAGLNYTVFFVAEFDQPAVARGVWSDKIARPDVLEIAGGDRQQTGLYADFTAGATVGLRVGISFTSVAQAKKNLDAAKGMDFDAIRKSAEDRWRTQLSKIAVTGGTDAQRRQFYTALYHTALTPTDVTGDNGHWANDADPVYWDIHTLWDTFRSADPLRVLIDPDRERGLIRSLLMVYQKTGWLPDAWAYNKSSIGTQGGTHADNVIADAVVKKLGGFDTALAYAAVRKNATEFNPKVGKTYPNTGRLPPYFTLGYVPSTVYTGKDATGKENEWSSGVSRTLEYSYNDFCVSEVAAALGHAEDAAKFRKQSLSAYTLFDPARQLFWGKTAEGQWVPDADPKKLTMGWSNLFYEGSAWQYRFSMPHDMRGLIDKMGGDATFVGTLDTYFDQKLHNAGNEPGFLTPWLYIYAGRPDRATERVWAIMAKNFKLKPAGYPGDEDVGAMSGWYIFAAMGLFPNAGQDVYLLSSPVFSEVKLALGDSGKTLDITAVGLSEANRYVQSATLDGRPWEQAWVRHADIAGGARIELKMGPKPTQWGVAVRPPSLSDGASATP